jgi:hypothetical protein
MLVLILFEGQIMSGDVTGDIQNTLGFEYVLSNSAQEDSAVREATPIPAVRVAKVKVPSLQWIPTNTIESETFQVTIRLQVSVQFVAHKQ